MDREEAKSITEFEMTASEVVLREAFIGYDLACERPGGQNKKLAEKYLEQLKEIKLQFFLRGYETAVRDFGIYKDGVQKIGCLETPIKEVIERLYK